MRIELNDTGSQELDFDILDADFDPGIAVAKGRIGGTFYIETNTPKRRSVTRLSLHPRIAMKLRDWLAAHYTIEDNVHAAPVAGSREPSRLDVQDA